MSDIKLIPSAFAQELVAETLTKTFLCLFSALKGDMQGVRD
jgi:hypothetical protein